MGVTLASGVLTRSIGGPFGKPRRLTATSDGILWEPVTGRTRFVRWHEMRLLEVASIKDDTSWTRLDRPARRYTIYADHAAISWTESAPTRSSPSGDSAALLALTLARTGLALRTFDRVLQQGGQLPPGVVVETIEPGALPSSPSGIYILALARSSRRARVIAGMVGAVLTTAGIFAVVWSLDPVHAASWPNPIAAFFLGCTGLVGLLMLVAALNPWPQSHPFIIRADPAGLTQDRSTIAWDAVAGIARSSLGTRAFYQVTSAADDTTIMWIKRAPQPTVHIADGTPVTPAELAAVVSVRSGKPIQVMRPRGRLV